VYDDSVGQDVEASTTSVGATQSWSEERIAILSDLMNLQSALKRLEEKTEAIADRVYRL
jgi:hypothetical protein